MTTILAIDFSKGSTGLAWGQPGDLPRMTTRSFSSGLGGDDIGSTAASVIIWIGDALKIYQPDLVVIEAALPKNDRFARIALGADFLIRGACKIRSVRCEQANNKEWKTFFHGAGGLSRSEGKARSLAVSRALGLEPKNDDEADASGIWFWTCNKFGFKLTDAQVAAMAKAQRKLL